MHNVELVHVTPDAESLIAYMARVSNPANQDNDNYTGCLLYTSPSPRDMRRSRMPSSA